MSQPRLRIRRGDKSAVNSIVPAEGEPLWVRDEKELRLGDGETQGGIPIASQEYVDAIEENRRHTHEQLSPAQVWEIEHNLGFRPFVSAKHTMGSTLNGYVEHIDDDNLTVTFAGAVSGTAYLSA